jgi:putative acetyltransferase
VAVAPEQTGRGYGTALVKEIRRLCLAEGRTLVVVGDPEFYRRAGFSAERAAGLVAPEGRGDVLIARPGEDVPEARLVWPEAFAGL